MPELISDFVSIQNKFIAYIRDPNYNSVPQGIKPERMDKYREFVFNNIEDFLATNFPVLKTIMAGDAWLALTRDFILEHTCHSPYFFEIAEEFLAYLQDERNPENDDPVFLLELAHYEWVEMALAIAVDSQSENSAAFKAEPMQATLALSPLAWSLVYQFPVHQIEPDFQPEAVTDTPTYLIVYRNSEFAVKFIEINAISYRLLDLIQDGEGNAETCFQHIAQESGLDYTSIANGGASLLTRLAVLGVITPG